MDFDVSSVPILILTKQEQQGFYLQEYQQGLISVNEYRTLTDRKKVEAELADSILANPNLTPIANTEKPMEDPAAAQQDPMAASAEGVGMAGVPGADPMASPEGAIPMGPEGAPAGPEGALAGLEGAPAGPEGAPMEEPPAAMNLQAGVPLTEQASQAQQSIATEFSPEEGGFVPLGSVSGTERIEAAAEDVESELDGFELEDEDEEEIEGKKSLPFLKSV